VHTVVQEDNFMGIPLERLRGKKQSAFIGYLSLNLYDPPKEATWGRYNDRVVNPDWVAKLVEDFAKRLDNCTNEDALEAVVKRTWIQNMDSIEPTVNDKKIKEVEEIEFTREGKIAIAPDNLVMLGGNHRRLALKIYVDALKEQLEKDNKQVKTKTTQAHKQSDITGPIGAELKELKERVEWLEGKIAISRHWVVALYDIGTQ
jgi:hypothetical protein